jgi:hypothetical protein
MSDEEGERKVKKQKTSSKPKATNSNTEEKNEKNTDSSSIFPIARVQKIIKLDDDVNKISAEAVFLISKATVRNILQNSTRLYLIFMKIV